VPEQCTDNKTGLAVHGFQAWRRWLASFLDVGNPDVDLEEAMRHHAASRASAAGGAASSRDTEPLAGGRERVAVLRGPAQR